MTTCRDALRAASGMLAQAGVPDPAVDAAFLLSHVTGTPHLLLRAEGWRELTQSQLADYQALIDRRCQREPLQYILGTAQFMGVTLRAQPGALIPRNDTETLCEQALARMQGRERVLDLCTGTGALAIAIALQFPGAQVTAADISADALAVARQNIADTGARVTLRQGDLFAAAAGERFDIIVSNLNCDLEAVTPEAKLTDDLELDSLDAVDLISALEEEFDVTMPDDAAVSFQTVGDIVRYLEANAQ